MEVPRCRGAAAGWREEPGRVEAWVLSKRRGGSCAGRWEAAGRGRRGTAAGRQEAGHRSIAERPPGRWEEATERGWRRTRGAGRGCRKLAARLRRRCWLAAGSCGAELQTKDRSELRKHECRPTHIYMHSDQECKLSINSLTVD